MSRTVKFLDSPKGGGTAEIEFGLFTRTNAFPLEGGPEESQADPIRVLIVEDDENYREIVSSELAWHGFAVRTFAHGDALLGSIDAVARADVIVLDWRLPTISGIDLMLELQQRGIIVPMVFLTSHTEPSNEHLAFKHGARGFIDKTRGVEALASRLKQIAQAGKQY